MIDQTSCHLWWKISQDNYMTDRIGAVYAKNCIELLWPIELGTDYEKNEAGQLHDWSYRCGLHRKWNWVLMTNLIKCSVTKTR